MGTRGSSAFTQAGFENVLNLEGGLEAYSSVDESVPRY
jgi:rhodanese-related sulfurtransferase